MKMLSITTTRNTLRRQLGRTELGRKVHRAWLHLDFALTYRHAVIDVWTNRIHDTYPSKGGADFHVWRHGPRHPGEKLEHRKLGAVETFVFHLAPGLSRFGQA